MIAGALFSVLEFFPLPGFDVLSVFCRGVIFFRKGLPNCRCSSGSRDKELSIVNYHWSLRRRCRGSLYHWRWSSADGMCRICCRNNRFRDGNDVVVEVMGSLGNDIIVCVTYGKDFVRIVVLIDDITGTIASGVIVSSSACAPIEVIASPTAAAKINTDVFIFCLLL